jgi:hypothetical protein
VTLLVGILSTEGVVIATDRQVTHGALGSVTVAQAGSKVEIIAGQALYASAGPISVGQQIHAAMQKRQPTFGGQTCAEAVPQAQADIRAILNPAFETANKAKAVMGQLALTDVLSSGFLAAKFKTVFTCSILALKVPAKFCQLTRFHLCAREAESKMLTLS